VEAKQKVRAEAEGILEAKERIMKQYKEEARVTTTKFEQVPAPHTPGTPPLVTMLIRHL
jgi:hypothetical protein